MLFDPNDIVDDNSVVGAIVKQQIVLLQKCLKSQSKAVYFAAIENIRQASENFGPALNKHLHIILPLVQKRQDLASNERIGMLRAALLEFGGTEAEKMLLVYPLKQ